jgi:hypothetical protein
MAYSASDDISTAIRALDAEFNNIEARFKNPIKNRRRRGTEDPK